MKTRTLIVVAFFAAFAVSCKKDQKAEEAAAPVVESKENFSVEVDVVTDKEDNFPLYFTEDGTTNFDPAHAVWKNVKGQPEQQTVTLDLSQEIIPTDIRIDFGVKKGDEQADVTLSRFKMSYYGKSFETKGSDFLKYFIPNDSVKTEIDHVKGTITFKKNAKSKLDRFYYPQQTVLDEIKKITK
jgi:hypothetical protein